jgi:hypothetical protein
MNQNQLMTAGAVAFAGFALWYVFRTPGRAIAGTAAQQQRDAGLAQWLATYDKQHADISDGSTAFSLEAFKAALGRNA